MPRVFGPLILYLARSTLFDWNAVSSQCQAWLEAHAADHVELSQFDKSLLTPSLCRETFAALNAALTETDIAPAATSSPSTTNPSSLSSTSSTSSLLRDIDVDNLSFHEILQKIELLEKENAKRKEEIFNRVLSSLGDALPNSNADIDPASKSELSMINDLKEENRRKKEAEELRRSNWKREQEEQRQLQIDRDLLKRRFDKDCPDAEGIDPLAGRGKKQGASYLISNLSNILSNILCIDMNE